MAPKKGYTARRAARKALVSAAQQQVAVQPPPPAEGTGQSDDAESEYTECGSECDSEDATTVVDGATFDMEAAWDRVMEIAIEIDGGTPGSLQEAMRRWQTEEDMKASAPIPEPPEEPPPTVEAEVTPPEPPEWANDPHNPPTYVEALRALQPRFGECQFILSMGDTSDRVEKVLRLGLQLPLVTRTVLMRNWHKRREEVLVFMNTQTPFTWLDGQCKYQRPHSALPIPNPPRQVQPKRTQAGNFRAKYQRIDVPSSATGTESGEDLELRKYSDLVTHIIKETLRYSDELQLGAFPLVAPEASAHQLSEEKTVKDIRKIYGQAITARKNGGRVTLQGLRQKWSRLRRFFESGIDEMEHGRLPMPAGEARSRPLCGQTWGPFTVLHTCEFIDTTNYRGFSGLLKWAGGALGISHFTVLATNEVLPGCLLARFVQLAVTLAGFARDACEL